MSAFLWVLVALFVAGALLGCYAWLAPRKPPAERSAEPARPDLAVSDAWTAQAGEEFAGLTEPARCDLIFAVSDLRDERSAQMLVHALRDPADAVALAAAHALARRGRRDEIEAYVESAPAERAQSIVKTLALLQ